RGVRAGSVRGTRTVRRGIRRRGATYFGFRSGRVRYLAVADARLRRSPRAVRAALVRMKL
ncbi:MAG: hypothetical protein AVDCRST_MAG30-537, partial [uncultured Solirubrobacteraceae bacterium]